MPTESGSFEFTDPLHGYSYLSLFPRTCRTLGVVAKPTEFSDLESVHNVLKTVGLKEASQHVGQARMILESNSEDVQLEGVGNTAVEKEVEGVELINDEIARKRRPGLGRMQAKFNFNRRASQPAVIKEPKLDITKLEDPQEFFLAHERLENAKKELRKQSGTFSEMDVDINDMSLTARPRRPGIPGRSKATYKHHCPSVVSNVDIVEESSVAEDDKGFTSSLLQPESSVLSQENLNKSPQQPFIEKIISEATDSVKDRVKSGSIPEVDGFLDEILSGTYDHLNPEGQLILLQEQLQIKPINIDNLSLPKMPDIRKYDFKISGNIPRPRKSINDIQGAFTGLSTKTPVKATLTASSVRFSASPTPPKSPFAYLSSLKKHIMQLNRSKFSDFDSNPCSAGGSSPVNCADKQSDSVDVQGDLRSKFKVLTDDEDMAAASNKSSNHELSQDSRVISDPVDDISTTVKASSVLSTKSGSAVGDENGFPEKSQGRAEYHNGSANNEWSDTQMQSGNATVVLKPSEPDPCLVDKRSSPEADGSHGKEQSTNSHCCSVQQADLQVECDIKTSTNKKTRRKTVPVHRNRTTIVHPLRDDIAEDTTDAQEQEPIRVEAQESREISRSLKRKGKSVPIQEHEVRVEVRKNQKRKGDDIVAFAKESCDDQSRICTGAELHDNQSHTPNNQKEQPKKLRKGNVPNSSFTKKSQAIDISSGEQMEHAEGIIHPRKKAKRKELTLRKSIAAAGTSFQSGVRRSTRHRVRPLEFWRGERFLYGRLEPNSTLPTLIGVKKYDTPAKKEGKAILKVEDRVDGKKYRELIDLAALH